MRILRDQAKIGGLIVTDSSVSEKNPTNNKIISVNDENVETVKWVKNRNEWTKKTSLWNYEDNYIYIIQVK